MWHLRRKRAPVRLPRRIQVALASRADQLVLVMPVSLESPLVLVGLAPLVLVALVNLAVRAVLVTQANPAVHAAPAMPGGDQLTFRKVRMDHSS